MYQAKSKVKAERAAKYVEMLTHHFSRKVSVEKKMEYSKINFPMGQCYISADNGELHFLCKAESDAALQAVRGIIDRHIPLLKHIRDAKLSWSFKSL